MAYSELTLAEDGGVYRLAPIHPPTFVFINNYNNGYRMCEFSKICKQGRH